MSHKKQICRKCGMLARLTKDHLIPTSKGGCDGKCNIWKICAPCNAAKGDRLPNELEIMLFFREYETCRTLELEKGRVTEQ